MDQLLALTANRKLCIQKNEENHLSWVAFVLKLPSPLVGKENGEEDIVPVPNLS
jgi:hypothetical protein